MRLFVWCVHRLISAGRTFLYWIGPTPAIFSVDLELIKDVLRDRTGLFAKDFMIPVFKLLLGNGLILANGDDWKRHRKVVLPAFNHERIKVGLPAIYYMCIYLYVCIIKQIDLNTADFDRVLFII